MDGVFEVLAEPTRRAILGLLLERERSVGELGKRLKLAQPSVSKHLKVMRLAKVVDVRAEGQQRVYRVRPAPFRALETWLAPYRRLWETSLDRLEQHLDRKENR